MKKVSVTYQGGVMSVSATCPAETTEVPIATIVSH